ncbi:hypothetical protein BT96DRAFT_525441 [Gymnopus androsaceus JB14]|uniref:F-box domain-containing protein n=1 Tax=Gymnopus androsaceus JB14 TaxID=1447944 RepID=A0A6A4IFN6_9AGAR|nr:hypothetical protein BT96DRAFT_525441 [Gymnopus androsaceus JB14]
MPVLETLDINFFVKKNSYYALPCNWGRLTTLQVERIHLTEVMKILVNTPRMQSIKFNVYLSNNFSLDNIPTLPVHLHNLNEMRLTLPGIGYSAAEIETLTSMFNRIQCPALRLLSFTCQFSSLPFVGQSLHALETLQLDMPVTSELLTDCISWTPSLTTFQLSARFMSNCDGSGAFSHPLEDSHLFTLTPSATNSTPSWPQLENIRIFSQYSSPFPTAASSLTSAALVGFLESRSLTLKSCDLLLLHPPSLSEVELDTLRNLKKDGMKLRVRWAKPPPESGPDLPDTGLVESPKLVFPRADLSPHSNTEGLYGMVVIV